MSVNSFSGQPAIPASYGFTAGKNKIINGDFYWNQRAFSSTTSALVYTFDRFFTNYASGTTTYSAQTFTPGTAPVAGYEGVNFLRAVTSGQTGTSGYAQIRQRIEDVRTLAGQTATISFWAKANSGTPKIGIELVQEFGSGGSPSADVTTIGSQAVTISTSWARYSLTVSVPSISGKTIGTTANTSSLNLTLWISAGTDFNSRTGSIGLQNNTFDVWGIQVEAGSVATAFQTATGTLAGELAACQRYYWRSTVANANEAVFPTAGTAFTTTVALWTLPNPTTMRSAGSSIEVSNVGVYDSNAATSRSGGTWSLNQALNGTVNRVIYTHGSAVFTAGSSLFTNASGSNAYFAMNAEL